MEPRYRKSKPQPRVFENKKEETDFLASLLNAQDAFFTETKHNLSKFGFQGNKSNYSPERVEAIVKLADKVEKFCPHIDKMPTSIKHLIIPSIGVCCCVQCLDDFLNLALSDTSGCDLCGVGEETDMYVEISIMLGFGNMSVNLGEKCCAPIFTETSE